MKEISLNEKILYDLYGIEKCPHMFFGGEITYKSFETYLNGYFRGLEHYSGVRLQNKIMRWYEEKVNQKSSCFFTAYVELFCEEKSEEERIHILIGLTEAFFQENPEWYL